MNPGYVFAPYVILSNVTILEEGIMPKKKINSRYVQTIASRFGTWLPLNERRIKKIKKILKKIEDLKNQK